MVTAPPAPHRFDSDELRAVTSADLPADVDGLTAELRELETLKCAIEARQARAAVALDAVMRRRAADAGVPAARQGRGAAEQVAWARRVSPHRGRILLGLAKAVEEMPHLKAAFAAGRVSEWRAMLLARETACLTLVDRQRVDSELAADAAALEQRGDRALAGAARRRAAELDAASVARRRARAESERRVSIRPAPDTMVYLTALLPVVEGVAAYASLKSAADTAVATGAATSRGQAMADALVARVTGHAPGSLPLRVNLVINEDALLGDSEESGHLEAAGVLEDAPADLARSLIAQALDHHETVALRRLFTAPATGQLVAMESTARLFPESLARFIRLRDRVCRTPWCDAPIRHLDHRQPWAEGGRTSAENGQGLCEQCNHARQSAAIPTGPPPPIRRAAPPPPRQPVVEIYRSPTTAMAAHRRDLPAPREAGARRLASACRVEKD
jgi:hypothetical protein